jgi:hypothetical protein
MAECDRLEDCGHPDCTPLESWDGRSCCGRLPVQHPHLEQFNTHRLCLDADEYEINIGDNYYIGSLMITAMKDVLEHHLYNPCNELAITDPVKGLIRKLTA